jgi:hypothetical protein
MARRKRWTSPVSTGVFPLAGDVLQVVGGFVEVEASSD